MKAMAVPDNPLHDLLFNAFDLDKAGSLLKQAGVDSLQMDSTFRSNSEEGAGISQIIQGDLAKLGIRDPQVVPRFREVFVFALMAIAHFSVAPKVRSRWRARCSKTATASRLLPNRVAISAEESPSTLAMRMTSR